MNKYLGKLKKHSTIAQIYRKKRMPIVYHFMLFEKIFSIYKSGFGRTWDREIFLTGRILLWHPITLATYYF